MLSANKVNVKVRVELKKKFSYVKVDIQQIRELVSKYVNNLPFVEKVFAADLISLIGKISAGWGKLERISLSSDLD